MEPLLNAPATVTPLGAIAYRLDAIASELCHIAEDWDLVDVDALARKLWGAMDDLVAYGQDHDG